MPHACQTVTHVWNHTFCLQARNNRVLCGQVYVAESGYMLVSGTCMQGLQLRWRRRRVLQHKSQPDRFGYLSANRQGRARKQEKEFRGRTNQSAQERKQKRPPGWGMPACMHVCTGLQSTLGAHACMAWAPCGLDSTRPGHHVHVCGARLHAYACMHACMGNGSSLGLCTHWPGTMLVFGVCIYGLDMSGSY